MEPTQMIPVNCTVRKILERIAMQNGFDLQKIEAEVAAQKGAHK